MGIYHTINESKREEVMRIQHLWRRRRRSDSPSVADIRLQRSGGADTRSASTFEIGRAPRSGTHQSRVVIHLIVKLFPMYSPDDQNMRGNSNSSINIRNIYVANQSSGNPTGSCLQKAAEPFGQHQDCLAKKLIFSLHPWIHYLSHFLK
jgi:hypothetical protein